MTGRRPEAAADPGDDDRADTGRYLVAQALADLVEGTALVLTDERSRAVVRDAYRAATDEQGRSELERAFADAASGSAAAGDRQALVRDVVDAVRRELADEGVRGTLVHEASAVLPAREVACYEFQRTRDPAALEAIPLSAGVRSSVLDGARAVSEGQYDEGIERFEDAIEAAETDDDAVTPRVLAAWAHHWAGEDARALDYLEEAMNLHYGAGSVRLAAAVADHDSPDLFRDGTLSARAFLRVLASAPPGSDLSAAVGYPDAEGDVAWEELSGDPELLVLPRLEPETRVRIRLTGPIDAMPGLQAYYLALGIVDEAKGVPRNVERQPLSGPAHADPVETIRFERS